MGAKLRKEMVMKRGISFCIVIFLLIWLESFCTEYLYGGGFKDLYGGELKDLYGGELKVGPDYKVFVQKIKSPDSQWWFALFADLAGFGDPSWHLCRFSSAIDVENLKLERGITDPEEIFWNYSEGGDQTDNPRIELVSSRYIVFTRGGLHHSLYDIQKNRVLVNNTSPYHAVVFSEEYEKLTPEPSMKETSRMVKEWKIRNLHKPIEKIIGRDSKK